jgi:hypothetical protein
VQALAPYLSKRSSSNLSSKSLDHSKPDSLPGPTPTPTHTLATHVEATGAGGLRGESASEQEHWR